ncbi:MAG: DNA alkylation repair protein [Candidatus Obscuribacter sp.]|nr:DNA alkylation repair protein [Candidatus Obscuribacter sp.]
MSTALVKYIQSELATLADPVKAEEMAAYMRTEMPFYGVQKPDRVPLIREMKKRFPPVSLSDYQRNVLALWQLEHREEKYLAINYADSFKQYMIPQAVPLFERLVREGQWWDFVDPIASWLVGRTLLSHEESLRPVIETYVQDEDFWIRRTALLAHLGHKKMTNSEALFRYCTALAGEKEFFIRKAIGWALREYSKSEPEKVSRYLKKNADNLSPLSYKEGAKHLVKMGLLKL